MNITKAIILVAGWGTRMLPITKSIEKCMLPVGKRPVIDYIVQDVIKAGVKDIYFVVGEQSSQLQSYYRSNIPLNDYLRRQSKEDLLPLVAPLKGVKVHFVVQPSTGKYGTAVPASLVNEFIEEGESALFMNGDQFFYRTDDGSNAAELIEMVNQKGVTAGLYGNPVPHEDIPKYGIIDRDADGNFVRIVEKPDVEDAPSDLNNSGFYIFNKEIFELATKVEASPRGEYEVVDAINAYVANGGKVAVNTLTSQYTECGSVQGWLRANNVIVGADSRMH